MGLWGLDVERRAVRWGHSCGVWELRGLGEGCVGNCWGGIGGPWAVWGRGLRGAVGCVGLWAAWGRGLCGAVGRGLCGAVGCVGPWAVWGRVPELPVPQARNEPDVYETSDLPEDDQAEFEAVRRPWAAWKGRGGPTSSPTSSPTPQPCCGLCAGSGGDGGTAVRPALHWGSLWAVGHGGGAHNHHRGGTEPSWGAQSPQ